MLRIYFATSNKEKLLIAQAVCSQIGINVEQAKVDLDEIQGEDPKIIVEDKVRRAYAKLSKPVVVSDDSWDIPALNGFPGPYMKSINHWFTAQDFLRLLEGVKERAVILHQYLAYYDGEKLRIFSNDLGGQLIQEPRGKNERSPNTTITVLDHDSGKTVAEIFEQGLDAVVERYRGRRDVWHDFAEWYKAF